MVQSTRHSSWPVGPSEMAECIRRHDWGATPLGPLAGWPPHLRTAVDICLASPTPTAILWGEQRLQIYNDAYRAIALDRHPAILGSPALDNWPEAREVIGPILDRVFASGEPTIAENRQVRLRDAGGQVRERVFDFTFSAIRDRYGRVAGALHTVTETTARVHAEHRLRELMNNAGLSADFRALFQAAPAPLLLLAPPDFRILAANDAQLRTARRAREDFLGHTIFETLQPSRPDRDMFERELRDSLAKVMDTRTSHSMPMAVQGSAHTSRGRRWWKIINTPVLDLRGEVALVIHRAEDITPLVRLRSAREAQDELDRDQQALMERLRETSAAAEAERQAMRRAMARQSRFLAATLDSIPDYVYAFDREHRFTYVNRAMLDLFGVPQEQLLGRTFIELGYPEDLARRLDGHIERIFATGEPLEDEVFFTSPTGVRAYFQFVWGPVRGEDGGIDQVVGVSRDTSERRRMEERLRLGEARQSFLLQLGDRVRGLTDAARIVATTSAMVGQYLGVGRCGYGEMEPDGEHFTVEGDWTDGAMPSLAGRKRLAECGPNVVAQYHAGQTVVLDDARDDVRTRGFGQSSTGAERVRAAIGVPLFKDNRFVAVFYLHQTRPRHWTEEEVALVCEVAERTWAAVARARAERTLRESEQRYRGLFDAIDEGFCLLEKVATARGQPSDYRYLATNPAFAVQTGARGVVGQTMREVFPEASSFWYDTFDSVLSTGEAFRFEHGLITHGRIYDLFASRLDDGSGRRIAVIFNDITERKRHEQHQRLLLNELNHRVKNTLVTVQSMAAQSFRHGVDPEQARQLFDGRLMALSRAHDLLTRENWGGAPLLGIVQDAIAPYRDQHHDRIHAGGPQVWLPPRHALAFAMVLHELGTNAVKYGALSNDSGQVRIDWTVDDMLRLNWVESGGPRVLPPTCRGFGSRLIEHGLRHEIGGHVELSFAPGGVVCTIEAPLGHPVERAQPA